MISKQENTYAECAEDLDFAKKRDDNTAFTEITEVGKAKKKLRRRWGTQGSGMGVTESRGQMLDDKDWKEIKDVKAAKEEKEEEEAKEVKEAKEVNEVEKDGGEG